MTAAAAEAAACVFDICYQTVTTVDTPMSHSRISALQTDIRSKLPTAQFI